ncbi:MAG: preprotein translocase subunit SecE [Armatimonadota bacterium]|nr:preprotein translocase subunit SecE [Armatimonadota bacterium]MDW8156459.1 preprotein translocase subunit SecE [Armatimonadota bacterium]
MARVTNLIRKPEKVARAVARPVPRRGPRAVERATRYLREVRAELNRVTWPSRQEIIASTVVVLVVVGVVAAYLGAWDALFTWLFQRVLR